MGKMEGNVDKREGVLLYYKYVPIPTEELQGVCDWMRDHCSELGLRGRVRVAPDGVNVTLGGMMSSLQEHMNLMDADPRFYGCDFKAGICQQPVNSVVEAECGFQNLSVRIAKELVTLGIDHIEKEADLKYTGVRLSPEEFQKMLEDASSIAHEDGSTDTIHEHCSSSSPEEIDTHGHSCPLITSAEISQSQLRGSTVMKKTRAPVLSEATAETPPAILRNGEEDVGVYKHGEPALVDALSEVVGVASAAATDSPPSYSERRLNGSGDGDMNHNGVVSCAKEGGTTSDRGSAPSAACQGAPIEKHASKETVVLDVRNIYETRIGRFVPPQGVHFMDPHIRQFSDLPEWLDANEERLRGRRVMMYCTGGVRCERASAYLRSKGEDFQDVVQLYGGIHRYLEAFPDGKFFMGKNFVFDHRVSVSSAHPTAVMGTCLECHSPYDDYSARCRCSNCRLLILICPDCQVQIKEEGSKSSKFMCELCRSKACVGLQANPMCRLPQKDSSNSSSGRNRVAVSEQFAVPENKKEEKSDRKNRGRRERKKEKKRLLGAGVGFEQEIRRLSSSDRLTTEGQLEAEEEEGTTSWIFDESDGFNAVDGSDESLEGVAKKNPMCSCTVGKVIPISVEEPPFQHNSMGGIEHVCNDKCLSDGGARDMLNCRDNDDVILQSSSGDFPACTMFCNDEVKRGLEENSESTTVVRRFDEAISMRPLRILCLHGFRQSASSLQGRLSALRKKLRSIVDMVFVDAPHELPLVVVPRGDKQQAEWTEGESNTAAGIEVNGLHLDFLPKPRYAWLVGGGRQEHGRAAQDSQREPVVLGKQFDALQYKVQTDGWSLSLSHLETICRERGPFDGVLGFSQGAAVVAVLCALRMRNEQKHLSADAEILSKFADLSTESVDEERNEASARGSMNSGSGYPDDAIQRNGQRRDGAVRACAGSSSCSSVACTTLDNHPSEHASTKGNAASIHAPGIYGRHELGAEASACLDVHNGGNRNHHQGSCSESPVRVATKSPFSFQFAVLCSGFLSPVPEHMQLLDWAEMNGGIDIPSLHIFGSDKGYDRQIGEIESNQLAAVFSEVKRTVVCHDFGHIVPSQRQYVDQYVSFFKQFLL